MKAILNKCEFCSKEFRAEKTLLAHSCRLKMREQSRNEPEVKLALLAYQRFYQLTQGSSNKTWEHFSSSPYYAGFVKFARYVKDNNIINPTLFIDWVINKKLKLEQWASDRLYEEYLAEILSKEGVEAAVERTFLTMQEWADKFSVSFDQYFYHAGTNRIVHDITRGKISPWVLYGTETGRDVLAAISEEQLNYIMKYIEPNIWGNKVRTEKDNTEFVRDACEQAGIK